MSAKQSNLYSQAFNFGNLAEHSVDPRTGQYNCVIHLYQAPAETRNCPHFDLSLRFDSMSLGDIGFGKGWSLNLSKYKHRQSRTLSLVTGEHYQVEETKSSLAVKDQKLKSFLFEKSGDDYRVVHKSGDIEILSNEGNTFNVTVPVKLFAANGRSLDLEWTSFGKTPRLSQVKEGTEVLLKIDYSDFEVDVIISPDASAKTITRLIREGEDVLAELKLPSNSDFAASPSWKFEYEHSGAFLLIRQLTSPAGLVEELSYRHDGHRLPKGAPRTRIPYVISQTLYPGKHQPKMATTYEYSDLNFLGYGGVNDWDPNGDNLFNARAKYQYTSTVHVEGGAELTYIYNKFHLMVSSRRQQDTKSVTQRTEYYALGEESFENQPAQYQLPKTVEITYEDSAIKGALRTEKTHYSFDVWGNPTETTEKNGSKTIREYYSEDGETGLCPADPRGFRRYLKKISRIPATDGLTKNKEFRYTQLQKVQDANRDKHFVVVCQEASFEGSQMLSRTEYSHVSDTGSRDHGSIQAQVSWMGGQHEMTKDKIREYLDGKTCKETVTSTSFDGHVVNVETSTCLYTGRVLHSKDQHGTETVFRYDSLGSLVEEIVAPATAYEASRKSKYLVDEEGVIYGVTKTDVKGIQTRFITDGMERVVQMEKQDLAQHDTSAAKSVFRVMQKNSYNAIGQRVQVDKMDWLIQDHESTPQEILKVERTEYDDWGTVCRYVESTGVVHLAVKDPITMTQKTCIPGKGMVETKFNISGKPIETLMRKSDGEIHGKTNYGYDGWDRLVEQKDSLDRITRYAYDSFDRVVETLGPDDSISRTRYASRSTAALPTRMEIDQRVLGQQHYDGLARLTSKTAAKRTSVAIYDSDGPNPTNITTANGDHHTFSYDPSLNHALVNTKSDDGEVKLEHDKQTGAILRLESKTSIIKRIYSSSGLLAQEIFEKPDGRILSASSTYSLNGLPCSFVDVHGHKREIQYDRRGRVIQLAQATVRVELKYNEESLVSETSIRGVDEEGGGDHGLQIQVVYDDFGHEIERCIRRESGSSIIYRIRRTFNVASLMINRVVGDGQGRVLRDETFAYDMRDRLIDYECEGPQPAQDENGWKIRKQSFGFDGFNNLVEIYTLSDCGSENTKHYLYDPEDPTRLTRITNTHKDLSEAIDLLYDDNGCLIRGEEQRRLQYDTYKRLSAVYDSAGQVMCRYHYDALGQLIRQEAPGKPDTELHYHDGALVATSQGGSKTSYITDGHVYWGEVVQGGHQKSKIQLWAPDSNQSVLATVRSGDDGPVEHHGYTPYGLSTGSSPSIGFNGQWRDPITGWYHLGNGYRVYSPALMRFHAPDSWSPFVSDEINPYTYCRGDPVNNSDPSGHMTVTGRDAVIMAVGFGVSILAGLLTAGAGFAVELGVSIAVGAASDTITGAVYDQLAGPSRTDASTMSAGANSASLTQSSIASELVLGAIVTLIGAALGVGMARGMKIPKTVNAGVTRKFSILSSSELAAVDSLSVREIGFSQNSISAMMRLRTGGQISVAENAMALANQSLQNVHYAIKEFPILEVAKVRITTNGVSEIRYLSVHNRRLAVFKQALHGIHEDHVPVRVLRSVSDLEEHQ
ncbi:YD repeat-containing protein, partial [Fusarium bulbicola]